VDPGSLRQRIWVRRAPSVRYRCRKVGPGPFPKPRNVSALPGSGLAGAATLANTESAAAAGAGMPMMPMPTGAGANSGMPGRIGGGGASVQVVQQRPSVVPRVGV